MMMKQLFRHTSTLLRTALLLGAVLVNTQHAMAQIEGMPDAFETIDLTANSSIIGNGQYYYIQFFDGDETSMTRCYLSDQGAGNILRSKDYLPFAKNIQWTLVSAGGSSFYLKSGLNNFVKLDGTNYISTNNQGEATPLTVYKMLDGSHYEISAANTANAMYREAGRVWTNIIDGSHNYAGKDHNMSRCYLRIARLKDNVAHIIYYQDPVYDDGGREVSNGEYRGGREGFNKHHYLTYSSTGAQEQTNNWTSLITNGDMTGTDVSSFYIAENQPATIEDEVGRMGSRGISVNSAANQSQTWSTQFFVQASEVIGKRTVHLEFDYKANRNVNDIQVQAKTDAFDSYITHIGAIGRLGFTTSWKHYSGEFSIDNDNFKMIAFDLGMTGNQDATFYFDNIVFSLQPNDFKTSAVSSRSSVLDSYDAWSIPTAAKYHEDGLWTLEKGNDTDTGAEFYIKKYGGNDNEYLTTSDDYKVGNATPSIYYTVLGDNNNNFSKYVIESPDANRFTRIKNNAPGNVWGYARHLTHSEGDGWPVMERNSDNARDPDFWYAGFLPVEVPAQDNNYRVLLGVKRDKRTDNRIRLTGGNKEVQISSSDNLYSATFTPVDDLTNVFQIRNLRVGCYTKLVIEFGSGVVGDGWKISGIVNGSQGWGDLPAGTTRYEMDLEGFSSIDDLTVFNWYGERNPITISACYFTPEGQEPDCPSSEMLNHDGNTSPYSTETLKRQLWELEQVDDYGHFRLKAGNRYFQEMGQMTDNANNAAVFTNESLLKYFDLKWYSIPQAMLLKEIPVTDKMVTHKTSYLKDYSDDFPNLDIAKQGLASDIDSDWWNNDKKIQKTNHFEITHYVKQGESIDVYFPTILDGANDHIYYQRWYNYDEPDDNMDLNRLKAHLNLDAPNEVQYYLYKNGIVTGDRLYWEPTSQGYSHNAIDHIIFTNSDGQEFTLAADVSRYSDYQYKVQSDPLSDDLEEPTLTMRYVYHMKDASEMAANLSACTEGSTKWLEEKTIHFPAKQVAYNDVKWEGYRGEFIGLRHVFSDYWVYNGGNLVSAVDPGNASGKIKVEIDDPHHTGITLGGYNPFVNPRGGGEAQPSPQVGDIIRVYYENKQSNFNPRFKHVQNYGVPDWDEFQNNIRDQGSYFEATILTAAAAAELASSGLRFQGQGFTMTRVDIVPPEGNEQGRQTTAIFTGSETFPTDNWNTIVTINASDIKVDFTTPGNIDNYYQGFYFYDKIFNRNGNLPGGKTQYGDSRFVVFRYPKDSDGKTTAVTKTGSDNPAYLRVYFDDNGTRYQLAQFTLIFEDGCETLPWTSVNESGQVKGTDRDPNKLREMAGKPIAKITFDYPSGKTYQYPSTGTTLHHQGVQQPGGSIENSSPLPLTFDHTNYSFDGDGCNWAAYAMVSQKSTEWGNNQMTYPADHEQFGYNSDADRGMQKGFMYIDASEQPGDICAMDFQGEFCAGDKLMCSGWIAGSNRYSDNGSYRCPGGITLTVKGEPLEGGETETIYRFCPGQCYELDNGGGVDGSDGADKVVWQQFYFEFSTTKKFKRYWMEVNNNCVSSNGGDFMLDNVEVYALVPEVIPEMNTPICVHKNSTDLQLLKISVGFDKILAASNDTEVTGDASGVDHSVSFVFLEKDKFLSLFQSELASRGITTYEEQSITTELLEIIIERGDFGDKVERDEKYKAAYKAAFDPSVLGDESKIWNSNDPNNNKGAAVLNFHWNTNFSKMEPYTFAKAVNHQGAVFSETDPETEERFIVMNGNFPNELKWKINTDYYIVPYATQPVISALYEDFNICSTCSKKRVFQIKPPLEILGMDASDETQEYEVCEGKIPTVLTDLKGMNHNGEEVPLKDLNFDWWLGDPTIDADTHEPKLLATLENYHAQVSSKGVRLDEALSALRAYYPGITSLDGIIRHLNKTPNLTVDMIDYLQELVDKGQLILHQKSINIPAQKVSDDNPYCYFVACPIHDGDFEIALNNEGRNDVAYFCDEPQGLALKIGEKAPSLKCGFVSNENGFTSYAYPTDSDPVLSIRLAKKAQFNIVQHGTKNEEPKLWENNTDLKYLWLPIRNASTSIVMASDYNVYLASTDDPDGDKAIYREIKATGALPIVGKIVKLVARKDNPNGYNRLCVYFTDNFDVREGYTYTLSLPFKEADDANACDGTLLLNLKIVPDYEVWTGAAGNTDWNNDQNWRRADGNLRSSIDEPTSSSPLNNNELYRTNDLPSTSPLADYNTNSSNYRTAKDRLLRKGFAPLYCTHVLIKNNEWGDAPVLYDALDGKGDLTSYPFPNLRDKDGWDGTSEAAEPTKATATAILRFDMQARSFDKWAEVYGGNSDKGRSGDLIAEMYQVNSCDEIAFQAGAELLNAYLLNYNNAWMEYQLDNKRWYLMGSALQGTISGEWYAPKKTAQQKTTYYEPVRFNANDYDRYNPAIYQRSWDKAKAVLYEVGAAYSTDDNQDDLVDGGSASQGAWGNDNSWNSVGADAYLDRLGYKPMAGKKANVAIKGIWSNTYNDATVDYAKGGFSVMVLNHLKGANNDQSDNVTVVRLPKEDLIYKYWNFDQDVSGTNTDLSAVQSALNRAKNRGRLKTDLLLPASTQKAETGTKYNPVSGDDAHYGYGDRTITRIPTQKGDNALPLTLRPIEETVSAGASNLGFYLVENPFPCGLNMKEFFTVNTGLKKKYWLLTMGTDQNPRQQLVQQAPDSEWITSDGTTYEFETAEAVVAPGQGFFVQATTAGQATTISFTAAMQAQTRFGKKDKENGTPYTIVVGTKQKTQPKVDDQGNPVYVQELNEDGTPKTDLQGNPIYVYELDIEGNPVIDETTGQPKLLQAVELVFENTGTADEPILTPVIEDITDQVIIYSYKKDSSKPEYKLKTRGSDSDLLGLVITAQRDNDQTSALVMQRDGASNDFLPEEDTEVFINSDFVNAPTVYTLCGRLATTINTLRDFRSLPLGVESTSDAPCTLTFRGVEMLGDSISFYDAVEQKLTPLESGMTVTVSGQTQNRYYLVRSLNKKDAAEETHLQIFTEGLKAKVIASTAEPITVVRCFDTGGRLLYTASPQSAEYSFDLPRAGVYIIEAETEHDRKTRKVIVK